MASALQAENRGFNPPLLQTIFFIAFNCPRARLVVTQPRPTCCCPTDLDVSQGKSKALPGRIRSNKASYRFPGALFYLGKWLPRLLFVGRGAEEAVGARGLFGSAHNARPLRFFKIADTACMQKRYNAPRRITVVGLSSILSWARSKSQVGRWLVVLLRPAPLGPSNGPCSTGFDMGAAVADISPPRAPQDAPRGAMHTPMREAAGGGAGG